MTKQPRLNLLRSRVSTITNRMAPGRPKVAAPAYQSREWKALIAAIIHERGRRCEDLACESPNRGAGQRVYGDHVIELADGGALLDPDNVMLRCAPCHGRKTVAERNKRMAVRW
jgi:5-methylcytosine-specific restriction protein A